MSDILSNNVKGSTSRLKLLLQLWWTQKRRTFRWADVFVGVYFAFLFLLFDGIIYLEIGEQLEKFKEMIAMGSVVIIIAAVMLFSCDILFKFMYMNDSVLMDDFLKTKPFRKRDWNRFILISCFANGWNLLLPFLVGFFAFFLMSAGEVLVAIVMAFVMSAMNSMLLANIRKSKGWELKLPMFLALFFYTYFAFIYSINILRWSSTLLMTVFTLITLAGIYTLFIYFAHLARYDEHQARVSKVHNLGEVSLFSMEYISVLRSKRLRLGVLVPSLCMLLYVYMPIIPEDMDYIIYVISILIIWFPSMWLGQWIFGVEGNYFQGLITKPVSIRQILLNKYNFYALLSMAGTLLLVPGIWLVGFNPWFVLSGFVFVAGFCSLILFPSCLFSTRIDLFSSSFMNYQGFNKKINLYSLVQYIPLVLVGVLGAFTTSQITALMMFALGILGFTVHRWVIDRLAKAFKQRRYKRLQAYME